MEKLNLSLEFHKKLSITVLDGEFNQYEGEEDIHALADMYQDILHRTEQKDFILEFHTPRIGTVGINTLTEIYQIVADNDGRLILINFPKSEMRYMEITGFIHYVTCLSNRLELNTAFQAGQESTN